MSTTCKNCQDGQYEEFILPEHMETIGGIDVCLKNTVHVRRCAACSEEQTMIPDMIQLVRVVALARALMPIQLRASDVKLMRRALDLTQKEFAEAVQVKAETISRWESGAKGVGGFSDHLVRHNVCALLSKLLPWFDYDPSVVTNMRNVQAITEGEPLPHQIEVERVMLKHDGNRERVWDVAMAA